MPGKRLDLPQGTLDLQILSSVLEMQQGSLCPAIHRSERRSRIQSHGGASESDRHARFYELIKIGRKQFQEEESNWHTLVAAVTQILETA